jgi:PEP-CTERM motif-containing protein
MGRAWSALLSLGVLLGIPLAAQAGTVNILWYTGGTENSGPGTYESGISGLVSQALSASGNTWNITFWTGGAAPSGSFNALVVASDLGGWSTFPDYTALQNALTGGLTLGDRVMVTGQDADWHYLNSPGPTTFDGPQGFLIDSINWAGSGSGLGAVFLAKANTDGSFLAGLGTESSDTTDNVVIPAAFSSFPINQGLTTTGLSNWSSSAHYSWDSVNTSLWTPININGDDGLAVTLVSAGTASGGTGGTGGTVATPEPASLTLLGIGAFSFVGYRLRRRTA